MENNYKKLMFLFFASIFLIVNYYNIMEFTNKKKIENIKIQNDSLFEFILKNDNKFKYMYNRIEIDTDN